MKPRVEAFERRHAQAGMTLVEQLVTLVLISVGLLGIAALQVSGLNASKEMHVRLRASTLGADILDRIRANRQGFYAGDYDVTFDGIGAEGTTARLDLATWQAEIDRSLPGGPEHASGAIRRTPGTDAVTVVLRWSDASRSDLTPRELRTLEIHTEM